jgi:hypothetical protein
MQKYAIFLYLTILIKKRSDAMRILIITLAALGIVAATNAAALNPVPVKVVQNCCDVRRNHCIEYPVKNTEVFVALINNSGDNQVFMRTDRNGMFYLDDNIANKAAMVYLANYQETIFAGCHSKVTRTSINKVVLDGLCPSNNCKII